MNEPLIDPEQLLHSNLFTVRVGSAYSIPDQWSQGGHFNYIVGLPVPVSAEVSASLERVALTWNSTLLLKPTNTKEFYIFVVFFLVDIRNSYCFGV